MRICTITNQKGKTGKTVLATNLAIESNSRGQTTLLIALDPQQSALK